MSGTADQLDELIEMALRPAIQTGVVASAINEICDRIISLPASAELAKLLSDRAAMVADARKNSESYFEALRRLENLLWAQSPTG